MFRIYSLLFGCVSFFSCPSFAINEPSSSSNAPRAIEEGMPDLPTEMQYLITKKITEDVQTKLIENTLQEEDVSSLLSVLKVEAISALNEICEGLETDKEKTQFRSMTFALLDIPIFNSATKKESFIKAVSYDSLKIFLNKIVYALNGQQSKRLSWAERFQTHIQNMQNRDRTLDKIQLSDVEHLTLEMIRVWSTSFDFVPFASEGNLECLGTYMQKNSEKFRFSYEELMDKNNFYVTLALFAGVAGNKGIYPPNPRNTFSLITQNRLNYADFVDNDICDQVVKEIATELQMNTSIKKLWLSGNRIGDAGAAALGEALQVNKSLEMLCLWGNKIGDAGADSLAKALELNKSLQELDLRNNKIGDAGAQGLGMALQVNSSLKTLYLSSNQIGDAGAQDLGMALQVNSSLKTLYLSDNQIGDAGAQGLGMALQVNKSLQTLELWRNKIGDAGANSLAKALEMNKSLQTLLLYENNIADEGAQSLGVALHINKSLQILDLSSNQIGDAGVEAISRSLHVNKTLKEIDLRYNNIGAVMRQNLKKFMAQYPLLTILCER